MVGRGRAVRRRGDHSGDQRVAREKTLTSVLGTFSDRPGPQVAKPKEKPADPVAFDPCAPPDVRTPPQFLVPFRRPLLFSSLSIIVDPSGKPLDPDNPHLDFGPLRFNCVSPSQVLLYFALDLRLEQVWNLLRLSIGDLSSTMTLAPLEELTLEFMTSQRRVLEQNRVDSAEEMTSTESTTLDKEVVNTVASATKTREWHVDGSASFGIPKKLSAEVGAGIRNSTTETTQTTIDRTSEVTQKSAHNLKTLHKVEVKGVTEGLTQNRLTRKVKNPYPDRTLALNVFQLLKHFDVETRLVEIRPALIIQVNCLEFDAAFVLSNTDFLRAELLDPGLVEELPTSLQAVESGASGNLEQTRAIAKQALRYLYDEPVIFNIHDARAALQPRGGGPAINDPANSVQVGFDAELNFDLPDAVFNPAVRGFATGSGISDAVANNLGTIFTTLGFIYKVYQDIQTGPNAAQELDDQVIGLVTALANSAGRDWLAIVAASIPDVKEIEDDEKSIPRVIRNVLDNQAFTEIFRRFSGFLALVNDFVKPMGGTPEAEAQAVQNQRAANRALTRLLQHLQCNCNYYTERFLAFRAERTANQAIVDFVNQVLSRVGGSSGGLLGTLPTAIFDVEHAFLDQRQIVVQGTAALRAKEIDAIADVASPDERGGFNFDTIQSAVLKDLQVPTDGIHLEVAQGGCELADVPPPQLSLSASIHDASLNIGASGGSHGSEAAAS
jgi:hypothetical protein